MVQISDKEFEHTLECPRCGDNYLHHGPVTVYDRHEDAEEVRTTLVAGANISSQMKPNAASGNPSYRRDGIVIEFFCENCGDLDPERGLNTPPMTLEIAQHKGNTYLRWNILK